MKKYFVFAIVLVLSGLLASLTSYNTYATSYQYWASSVNLYRYSSDGDESITSTSTWSSNVSSALSVDQGYSVGAYCFYFSGMTANEGEYFTIAYGQKLYVGDVTTAVGVGGVSGRESIAVDWVDMSNTAYNTSGSQNRFVSYTIGGQFGADVSNWVCFNQVLQNTNSSLGFSMNFTKPSMTVYSSEEEYSSALAGIQTTLDSISSINSSMNSTLNSISSSVSVIEDSMDDLSTQEERVADVAEDEYNQTVEDREQASSDASGFAFDFELPNPFSIFEVSDGCVSTPTIDSWLSLEGDWVSPHCPIIPDDVRSTLTPIVTLIVSLASLMVVIRWVSSSNVGVSDDIGQGGYSNSLTAKVNADKIRRSK